MGNEQSETIIERSNEQSETNIERSSETKIQKIFRRLQSPWSSLVQTTIITLIGCIVSVHGKEALDGDYLYLMWVLSIIFIILFLLSQYALNEARSNIDKRLISTTDGIIDNLTAATKTISNDSKTIKEQLSSVQQLIKTMPPEAFLQEFSNIYGKTNHLVKRALREETTLNEIEIIARDSIKGILTLIKIYDKGTEDDIIYSGNIMLFNNTYLEKSANENLNLKKSINFLEDTADILQLRGILELKENLSANSSNEGNEKDNSLKLDDIGFSLPVPKEHEIQLDNDPNQPTRYKALAGAPLAFSTCKPIGYTHLDNLHNWIDQEGDFSSSIADKVKSYFQTGKGREIKSFICFPIMPLNEGCHSPIGILNIHKNRDSILEKDGQVIDFWRIITPFIDNLYELMVLYNNKKH